MNIEIANRLYEYRKKSGLSQEELADKLNISRQSVSKWERAEAAPDTSNLIELAKIYGVTLDELINVELPLADSSNNEVSKVIKTNYEIEDVERIYKFGVENQFVTLNQEGLRIVDNNEKTLNWYSWDEVYIKENNQNSKIDDCKFFKKNERKEKVLDALKGSTILVVTFIYVLLCALKIQSWGKFWVIFVAFPAISSIFECFNKKNANVFAFPVFITALYLFLGVYFKLWHPYWFLFLLTPIYYAFVQIIPNKKGRQKMYFIDVNGIERCFEVKIGDLYIN